MSKMGDLFIEISEKLEKQYPDFKDAADCGCNNCEDLTNTYIQVEFLKMSNVL